MVEDVLYGEVAVPAFDVRVVAAHQPHRAIARTAGHFLVVGFVHVAVVVDPVERHHAADRPYELVPVNRIVCPQRLIVTGKVLTGPPALLLQCAQDGHQVAVALLLQLANRPGAGLLIRLRCDLGGERVVELGHVRQPAPGPLQGGCKLADEVRHPALTAGDPVGLEQPHLRPTQAERLADDLIDLRGAGEIVPHEPQGFAPKRFKQSVADVRVDLLVKHRGVHADAAQNGSCGLKAGLRGARVRDDFDQRQQVNRVVRVRDDQLLRAVG